MTTDHEQYADWDGAYVLGALPPAEREEYERHLAVCDDCRSELAELLPLPGLLRRVDAAEREALLGGAASDEPPADLQTRLLAAARAESEPRSAPSAAPSPVVVPLWRRTRTRIGLGLAAAAAVAAAFVVPLALRDAPAPPATASVTLSQTVPSPLSATVDLTRTGWGTRIDMTCFYAGEKGSEPSRDYGLFVIDRKGDAHEVSSWWAGGRGTDHRVDRDPRRRPALGAGPGGGRQDGAAVGLDLRRPGRTGIPAGSDAQRCRP